MTNAPNNPPPEEEAKRKQQRNSLLPVEPQNSNLKRALSPVGKRRKLKNLVSTIGGDAGAKASKMCVIS